LNPNALRPFSASSARCADEHVEGDLRRVHLEREAHPDLFEGVEDRVPALGEVVEPGVDHRVGHGGKL
jgi:hypothetical protein